MKRTLRICSGLMLFASALVLSLTLSPSTNRNSAEALVAPEVESRQQANWGLKTEATTRSIERFDSLGWAIEESNRNVFVGGKFLEVTNGPNTESQPYIAKFGTSTTKWDDSFTPDVGGAVMAIEKAEDGNLFVGGEMDTWNGQSIGALAKIDSDTGEFISSWQTRVYGGTSVVRDLKIIGDFLYVVGSFTKATDSRGTIFNVKNVIRVNKNNGNVDSTWLPQPQNGSYTNLQGAVTTSGTSVWGVAESKTNGTIYLAGWFHINDQPVVGINPNDASDIVWDDFRMNIFCCNAMYDVETTESGLVFATGEQHATYVYDENQDMKMIVNHLTTKDPRHPEVRDNAGGDGQELELVGDTVYAVCHCWGSHMTSTTRMLDDLFTKTFDDEIVWTGSANSLVAYDSSTGLRDQSFNPPMSGDLGGFAILGASDGCIWTAGGYNSVGDPAIAVRPGRDLVRLCDASGGTPAPIDMVTSCEISIDAGSVNVKWDQVTGADNYIIFRTVDGSTKKWRAKVSDLFFVDSNRDSQLVYFVQTLIGSEKSDFRECVLNQIPQDPVNVLTPPASCSYEISANSIDVSWPAANAATDYVIYRSVNGSQQYWRGKSTTTSFADSNRSGQLAYFVAAKNAAGVKSDVTDCTEGQVNPGQDGVSPVAACTVTNDADNAVISWAGVAGVSDYVIYRSVNGGNRWWRGKVVGTSFTDALRSGDINYSVLTTNGKDRSDYVQCTPTVKG